MAFAAAAGGAAGGLLGGGLSWGQAVTEGNKAWRRQKTLAQQGVRWRVSDMRAAGLNPILAVSPGSSAPSGGVNMPGTVDFASALARGAEAATSARSKSKIPKKDVSQAELNNAAKGQADAAAKAQNMQAVLHAANARVSAANHDLLQSQLPEARAKADAWSNPKTRQSLVNKYTLGGSNLAGTVGAVGGRLKDAGKNNPYSTTLEELKRNSRREFESIKGIFKRPPEQH